MAHSAPRVFLSAACTDPGFAQMVARTLRAEKVECFWDDPRTRADEDDWMSRLDDVFESADCYVILLSPEAMASNDIYVEIGFALARARRDMTIEVIPILVGDVEVKDLPKCLHRSVPIDASAMTFGELETQLVSRIRRVTYQRGGEDPPFAAWELGS
ncbi:MAG TPA: toll/interleukin-1 receptor domain-containing protein [Urbifossiella sp.]|nr:toll/interleukin-1 receptor domain-containing protein [Urbifossiella sp.]